MNSESLSEEGILIPHLQYTCRTGIGPREEASDFLLDLKAKITGEVVSEDGSTLGQIELGEISGTLIRLSRALNDDFPLSELLDARQDIHQLGAALFEPKGGDLCAAVQDQFENAFPHDDILFIRHLSLKPPFRGQRLGASALYRFMTDWEGGCALVALQARPWFEWEDDDGSTGGSSDEASDEFIGDSDRATAKLEQYFQGLGFRKIDSIPYLLYCPGLRQTPVDELALENSLSVSLAVLGEWM